MTKLPDTHFNGSDYDDDRDRERLAGQIQRVFNFMADGEWHSLAEVSSATGDPPASVSAQLRHLRKERFGSYTVEKDYQGDGLYFYRLVAAEPPVVPVAEAPAEPTQGSLFSKDW
jgi:hypothetical protein